MCTAGESGVGDRVTRNWLLEQAGVKANSGIGITEQLMDARTLFLTDALPAGMTAPADVDVLQFKAMVTRSRELAAVGGADRAARGFARRDGARSRPAVFPAQRRGACL